jgi:biotin transporter BioY
MTQDLETILRKSLDQTDRSIKVLLACWFFMAVAVVAGLLWLAHLSNTADVKAMIVASVVIILLALSVNLTLTCVFVAAMTRKTLKAIELLSKK